MSDYVYKDITMLETPIGDIAVTCGRNLIPFSVSHNLFNVPYDIYDDVGNIIDTIQTDTNYTIEIDVNNLNVGEWCGIYLLAIEMDYCASDERTIAYSITKDGWTVGIGAYNPNEDDEDEQAWNYSREKGYLEKNFVMPPPVYDETNMNRYRIEVSDDKQGFIFKLLDKNFEKICFDVAWIRHKKYESVDYEDAIGFWLT